VVEGFQPGYLDSLGIGWEKIHARRPDLPLISITNFGQTGPYRNYRASELTMYAYAGEMYTMGVREREPVTMYGTAALVESGSAAAAARSTPRSRRRRSRRSASTSISPSPTATSVEPTVAT
jgi:crotonobetainyl-CoA:carnitine CoA-transferase CaiB-like acyl-CoA transferase